MQYMVYEALLMDRLVKIVQSLKGVILVKWLKNKSQPSPNLGSAVLEEELMSHLAKIDPMIDQIIDLTVQERNILKDQLDRLTIEGLKLESKIEELRERSERVHQKRS